MDIFDDEMSMTEHEVPSTPPPIPKRFRTADHYDEVTTPPKPINPTTSRKSKGSTTPLEPIGIMTPPKLEIPIDLTWSHYAPTPKYEPPMVEGRTYPTGKHFDYLSHSPI